MISSDDLLDLAFPVTPDAGTEMLKKGMHLDAGLDPMSWADYFALLEEMKPGAEQLREATTSDKVFTL